MESKNKKLNISIILLLLCIVIYLIIVFFCYQKTAVYNKMTYPNIYLEEVDISNLKFSKVKNKIDKYNDEVLSKKIIFVVDSNEYEYTLNDLGVSIDKDKIIDNILDYQSKLSYSEKLMSISNKIKKTFRYEFSYSDDALLLFLNNLKTLTDKEKIAGGITMDASRNLVFQEGVDGTFLDVDKSKEILIDEINNGFRHEKVELFSIVDNAITDETYRQIDTKVSSFSTNFNAYISRAVNLRTALNYIDGVIVKPGEVFSFYKYAGPYNKKGYIFYYEFVGNGVCQIATTIYNTALLGGLEIVKRYPHDKQSVYVAGGLDATVASYSSGWNVDFQFKNTYNYPIYISAYAVGGSAHVDFWSNSNAKEGKTYSTESVKIGTRGYQTYLHTYQNGVEISKNEIAKTWYTKD